MSSIWELTTSVSRRFKRFHERRMLSRPSPSEQPDRMSGHLLCRFVLVSPLMHFSCHTLHFTFPTCLKKKSHVETTAQRSAVSRSSRMCATVCSDQSSRLKHTPPWNVTLHLHTSANEIFEWPLLHIPLACQIRLPNCFLQMEFITATIHDTQRRLGNWLNRNYLQVMNPTISLKCTIQRLLRYSFTDRAWRRLVILLRALLLLFQNRWTMGK